MKKRLASGVSLGGEIQKQHLFGAAGLVGVGDGDTVGWGELRGLGAAKQTGEVTHTSPASSNETPRNLTILDMRLRTFILLRLADRTGPPLSIKYPST